MNPSNPESSGNIKVGKVDPKKNRENYFFSDDDKFIHEPIRLLIMAYLYSVDKADMKYLQKELQVSWGNLSFHSTKLEERHYISIEKQFIKKKSYTILSLTGIGRKAFQKYRKNLKKIVF
ncbi:hypothetical protein NEF87_001778 [Candidatus Lokiarchaeum ossiferum]|uniref:Winged helix DNA-binding domain-containing protein n=1 Tax=Candidatus Lokiarchaeum ossiferum TaxID=2951803 RepID=A0ABY6HPP5_9ARCH|nr:hypothetical protein NEF87_001778 [Candidatus Lokiarchaeum sp. B-35]